MDTNMAYAMAYILTPLRGWGRARYWVLRGCLLRRVPRRLMMVRLLVALMGLGFLAVGAGADGGFDGEWRTSIGTVTLKQAGAAVTGTYGGAGQFTLKGTVR